MSMTKDFLERLEVFFPTCEDMEIVLSWDVSYQQMTDCNARGLPDVNIVFPGQTRMVEFWESFYLTSIRHQGEPGYSLIARHHPNKAGIELLLVRKKR